MLHPSGTVGLIVALLAGGPTALAGAQVLSSQDTRPAEPHSGKAQEPSTQDPPAIVTVVTVTAPLMPRRVEPSADVRTLPSSASVMTSLDVQNAQYREPGEVVRPLPGMGFSYYGQGGTPSGPTVRGYTDRNFGQDIAGFVDGIPLNLAGFVASHGALDLTVLVPETLERVELVRGPIEARYGDFNRGGTLNFITRDRLSRQSLTAGVGTYGGWNVNGQYGGNGIGSRRLSFFGHAGTQGSGEYADNQDLWHNRLFHRLLVPAGRGDFAVTAQNGWTAWNATGYLDKAAVQAGQADAKDAVNPTDGGEFQHNLFAFRYRTGAAVSRPFEATFYVGTRDWTRWRQDVLLGPTQPQIRQTDDRLSWGYRVEQTWGHFLGVRPLLFTAGTTLQRVDAETRQARTVDREFAAWNDDVDELITDIGAYVQGQAGLADWLKAVAGLRYTHVDYGLDDALRQPDQYVADYQASKWQPKIGVVLAPSRRVEIYTNYVVGMRSPTPRTEVRNSVGSVDRIQIARTENYEIGATLRPIQRLDIDATWWRADNSNEIRGIPPGGVQFESLGASRRHGASLDARWFLWSTTRLSASISRVNARLLTPTAPGATHLPDIPRFVHQVGLQTPLGAPGSGAGRFAAAFDLYFCGRKDLNTLGTIRSDAYQRGTFRLGYTHSARYRAWVGGFFYPGSRLENRNICSARASGSGPIRQ